MAPRLSPPFPCAVVEGTVPPASLVVTDESRAAGTVLHAIDGERVAHSIDADGADLAAPAPTAHGTLGTRMIEGLVAPSTDDQFGVVRRDRDSITLQGSVHGMAVTGVFEGRSVADIPMLGCVGSLAAALWMYE